MEHTHESKVQFSRRYRIKWVDKNRRVWFNYNGILNVKARHLRNLLDIAMGIPRRVKRCAIMYIPCPFIALPMLSLTSGRGRRSDTRWAQCSRCAKKLEGGILYALDIVVCFYQDPVPDSLRLAISIMLSCTACRPWDSSMEILGACAPLNTLVNLTLRNAILKRKRICGLCNQKLAPDEAGRYCNVCKEEGYTTLYEDLKNVAGSGDHLNSSLWSLYNDLKAWGYQPFNYGDFNVNWTIP